MAYNAYSIISEACKAEMHECDCADCAMAADELNGCVADVEEIDTDVPYDAEMVPVVAQDTETSTRYLIDSDMLAKYMDINDIDSIDTAVASIADANDIPYDSCYVVIPSDDDTEEWVQEAKASKNSKKLSSTTAFLKKLKGSNVGMLKKKRKKNKKK